MEELLAVLPVATAASDPFWNACERGEQLPPRCETCATVFFYPRIHCPCCGSRLVGWHRATGRGKVFSFTHVAVSFHGSGWESQLPYTVLLVDLEEGVRMVSRLVGDGRASVRSGDPVMVTFPEISGRRLPYFELATPITDAEGTPR